MLWPHTTARGLTAPSRASHPQSPACWLELLSSKPQGHSRAQVELPAWCIWWESEGVGQGGSGLVDPDDTWSPLGPAPGLSCSFWVAWWSPSSWTSSTSASSTQGPASRTQSASAPAWPSSARSSSRSPAASSTKCTGSAGVSTSSTLVRPAPQHLPPAPRLPSRWPRCWHAAISPPLPGLHLARPPAPAPGSQACPLREGLEVQGGAWRGLWEPGWTVCKFLVSAAGAQGSPWPPPPVMTFPWHQATVPGSPVSSDMGAALGVIQCPRQFWAVCGPRLVGTCRASFPSQLPPAPLLEPPSPAAYGVWVAKGVVVLRPRPWGPRPKPALNCRRFPLAQTRCPLPRPL